MIVFLMLEVFRVFDTDADNHISFEEFLRGMSVFLKGKLEERLKCRLLVRGFLFHCIPISKFASRCTT